MMTRRRLTATWPNSSPDWIIDQALLNVAAGVATSAAFNSVPTESCQSTRTTVSDTTAQVSRHRARRAKGVTTMPATRTVASCLVWSCCARGIDFLLDQTFERSYCIDKFRAAGRTRPRHVDTNFRLDHGIGPRRHHADARAEQQRLDD